MFARMYMTFIAFLDFFPLVAFLDCVQKLHFLSVVYATLVAESNSWYMCSMQVASLFNLEVVLCKSSDYKIASQF